MEKSTIIFERLSPNSIKVCAKGCCPIVILEDGKILIKDDFGNKISIEIDESLGLSEAVQKLVNAV